MSTIAHIGPANLPLTYARGGAIERRMLELSRAQVRRGHRVIAYSVGQSASTIRQNLLEIRQLPCRLPLPLRTLELARAALRQLQSQQIDVLHFHSVPEGAFLARDISARKFLSYDDFRFRRGRATPLFWCYRHMLLQFDGLLPVSEFCRRESVSYWKMDAGSAHVFYNGVNLEQFAPDSHAARAMRVALGLGDGPIVLYAGRVCEQKGTDVLLSAWPLVKAQVPEALLLVCGPALQFANSKETDLTRRISAAGGVYLGAVDDAQLPAVMNLCDVFVMPTRRDEMFGMAALEAQACGKPVVCSRQGGLPAVVSEQSGLFFPPGDHLALAACLNTLLRDRVLYARLAGVARQNAARFSWDLLAEQLESLYGTTGHGNLVSQSASILPSARPPV